MTINEVDDDVYSLVHKRYSGKKKTEFGSGKLNSGSKWNAKAVGVVIAIISMVQWPGISAIRITTESNR